MQFDGRTRFGQIGAVLSNLHNFEPGLVSAVYDRKRSGEFAKLLDSPRDFIATIIAGAFVGLSILLAAAFLSVSARYSAFESQVDNRPGCSIA